MDLVNSEISQSSFKVLELIENCSFFLSKVFEFFLSCSFLAPCEVTQISGFVVEFDVSWNKDFLPISGFLGCINEKPSGVAH